VGVSSGSGLAGLHLERPESSDRHVAIFPKTELDALQDRVDQTRCPESRSSQLIGDPLDQLALVHQEEPGRID
jgi:hypothetical protein